MRAVESSRLDDRFSSETTIDVGSGMGVGSEMMSDEGKMFIDVDSQMLSVDSECS